MFSFFDIGKVAHIGTVCSDNKNSDLNRFISEENSYVADCFTTIEESDLTAALNKFHRVLLFKNIN